MSAALVERIKWEMTRNFKERSFLLKYFKILNYPYFVQSILTCLIL